MSRCVLAFCLFGAALAVGCYSPGVAPCVYRCASGGECPDGLACNGNNLCAESATATCSVDDGGPTGPATVTFNVLDEQNHPAVQATVLFYAPDGTLTSAQTDSDGRVVMTVEAGTTATVVTTRPNAKGGTDTGLTTYMELWNGANITSQPLVEEVITSATVSFVTPPPSTVSIATTCGGLRVGMLSGLDATVSIAKRCAPDFDAVAIDTSASPTQFVVGRNFGANGAMFSLFAAGHPVTARVSNEPTTSSAKVLAAYSRSDTGRGVFGPVSAAPFLVQDQDLSLTVPAGYEHFASYFANRAVDATSQALYTFESFEDDLYRLDLDGFLMPWVSNLRAVATTRNLDWDADELGETMPAEIDVVVGTVNFFRPDNNQVFWRVIAPLRLVHVEDKAYTLSLPLLTGQDFDAGMEDIFTHASISTIAVSEEYVHAVVEGYDPHANVFDYPGLSPRIALSIGGF